MELQLPENVLNKLQPRIDRSAMFSWLNLSVSEEEKKLVYHLGFSEAHIGNPVIRAIHGGVVSTFLEAAAYLETYACLQEEVSLQTTSVHTSFLRSTKAGDMHAAVNIHRLGRRFAFLEATCWQEDRAKETAFAEIGIRIMRPDEKSTAAT